MEQKAGGEKSAQPKVSIIIPVYNVKKYLAECVKSAAEQTYGNTEILLVDDGSTDGSGELCDEFAKGDERIRVFHKANGGLSDARNYGMDRAEGVFLYFLDSDDYMEAYAIETLVTKAIENQADVVLFDARVIEEDGRALLHLKGNSLFYYRIGDYSACRTGKELFAKMLENKEYCSSVPLLFIRKEALKYRFESILHEDELFTIQLLYSVSHVLYYPEVLYVRRNRASSITTMKKTPAHYAGIKTVIWELTKVPGFDAAIAAYICSFYKKQQRIYEELTRQDKKQVYRERKELNAFISQKAFFKNTKLRLFYSVYSGPFYWLMSKIIPKKVREKAEKKLAGLIGKGKNYLSYLKRLKCIKKEDERQRIFMLGTPRHGNLGDHAIAIAEEHFIREILPERKYVEIEMPFYRSCKSKIRKVVREDDIIILSGGGWLGNQWFHNEKTVREIIKTYRKNKIVIFPQTIYYEQSKDREKQIKEAEKIYSAHPRLLLFLRDEASFLFAKEHGLGKCFHVPDIALYEKRDSFHLTRSDILLCKRADCEKSMADESWAEIEGFLTNRNAAYKETTTIIGNIPLKNRKTAFDKKLLEFARARLVITDRLHAMIFAAITGTPCVAFDNTSKKVSGVYFWLQNLSYIKCVKNNEQAKEEIERLLKQEGRVRQYEKPDFTNFKRELEEWIK